MPASRQHSPLQWKPAALGVVGAVMEGILSHGPLTAKSGLHLRQKGFPKLRPQNLAFAPLLCYNAHLL